MTTKLPWPNHRFLLPAGLLPPTVTLADFKYYEDLRSGRFSHSSPIAVGFEYYYIIDQDPQDVNRSPIGGKIKGVHSPWTQMKNSPGLMPKIYTHLLFKPPLTGTLWEQAQKTVSFAEKVGAEYVVFHTPDVDLENPGRFVSKLLKLTKANRPKLFLENDFEKSAAFLTKKPAERWTFDPLALYQKFRLPIVYDPATVEINGQSIDKTWQELMKVSRSNINRTIAHIHLNEFVPALNRDHGIMQSPRYADLLHQIAKTNYSGYFTFEVDYIQNLADFAETGLFVAASFLGLPKLAPDFFTRYPQKSQQSLYDSIKFSQKHLSV